MASSVILEHDVEIPFARSLVEFRAWVRSDAFPQCGRIDYVSGHIEVDMSPENLHFHGKVKTEINRVLAQLVKQSEAGELYSDRTRITCPPTELSVEPDVLFVSNEALDSGRARLVPAASGKEDDFVEIEGAVELVVEIVSDSSEKKDTRRLPSAYWQAAIREFWLIDVRGERCMFSIRHRGADGYQAAVPDADGFQFSSVFDQRFRLTRRRNRHGRWEYDLEVQ